MPARLSHFSVHTGCIWIQCDVSVGDHVSVALCILSSEPDGLLPCSVFWLPQVQVDYITSSDQAEQQAVL